MKTKFIHFACLLTTLLALATEARAQTTAFTYQGRLTENGVPANGSNDFTFTLYGAASGGATVGVSNAVNDFAVSNGLFTVTLDFPGAFDGNARWLQIAVRPGASTGAYTNVTPRQQITATPYAMRALSAGSAATATSVAAGAVNNLALASDAVDGAKILNGSVTSADLSASLLDITFWKLGGNAGTTPSTNFIGTTDNQPLEFKVNNQRGLRLEPTASDDTVNVIGGSARNSVGAGVAGATIGGGGAGDYFGAYTNRVEANFGTVSGGMGNTIQSYANFATIGGGILNTIQTSANSATIGGGYQNTIQTNNVWATIGGGNRNTIQPNSGTATIGGGLGNTIQTFAASATIGGGGENTNSGDWATIGGGLQNTSSGSSSVVPGGYSNSAGGDDSFAAGRRAKANHDGAFVWADSTDADFTSTTNDQFSIRASGGVRLSDDTPNLSFGTTTRQMLNLYSTNYGIGVQGATLYFRCDASPGEPFAGFRWYRGGAHYDGNGNAGGGTELMSLGSTYLYVNGTLVSSSDRNKKENFKPVDPRAVLEKVVALPLSEWNYKTDTTSRHLGPMAQDFYAAFQVGPDDKHITTVDESGVALAAIQGLNQKLEEKDAEIQNLRVRLEKLEQLLSR